MTGKKLWRSSLQESEKAFSKDANVKESKKNIFYAVMQETFPDNGDFSYAEAQNNTFELSEQNQKKRYPRFNVKTITAGALGTIAALFILTLMNTRNLHNQMSPPLTKTDFPPALSDKDSDFRSVSTSNVFFLGYAKTPPNTGTVEILVHSRSGDIDWNSLSASRQENDATVKPLSIDESRNIVLLPASEDDIYFSINDDNGNTIECIIPSVT